MHYGHLEEPSHEGGTFLLSIRFISLNCEMRKNYKLPDGQMFCALIVYYLPIRLQVFQSWVSGVRERLLFGAILLSINLGKL